MFKLQYCTKYGQLILRKIIKILATICHILRLKCTKFEFRLGLHPRPCLEAHSAPRPSNWIWRAILLLREEKGMGGKEREGEEKEERGKEGKGEGERRGKKGRGRFHHGFCGLDALLFYVPPQVSQRWGGQKKLITRSARELVPPTFKIIVPPMHSWSLAVLWAGWMHHNSNSPQIHTLCPQFHTHATMLLRMWGLGPVHTYTSTSMSPTLCSFIRVASDSDSCNSNKWSVHIDLSESELTRKLVAIFIIKMIIF